MEFVMEEAKRIAIKLVDEEMVQIYDKHFSHQEVKDLIAFYSSDTGKKFLQVTPELTKDLMDAMMTKHMPEFQERIQKKLKEFGE